MSSTHLVGIALILVSAVAAVLLYLFGITTIDPAVPPSNPPGLSEVGIADVFFDFRLSVIVPLGVVFLAGVICLAIPRSKASRFE